MAGNDDLLNCGSPWTRYRTLLDLEGWLAEETLVKAVRAEMVAHPLVRALIAELGQWPWSVISSHKSAGQPFHKLAFLAEIGLNAQDDGMASILERLLSHFSVESLPRLPMNIPVHFGGSGLETHGWALCDAPLLLHVLVKMGLDREAKVREGIAYLTGLGRANGWPCKVSQELGKFRGPGRQDDPCPYATLLVLKLLLAIPETRNAETVRSGVDSLLDLWQRSLDVHPYQFYMGTDFRKLKAPFIWYDILHVAEILSQSESARMDERFETMLDLINTKANQDGLFTSESVWKAWQDWDFGQKSQPSPWLTFLIRRINFRMNHTGQA